MKLYDDGVRSQTFIAEAELAGLEASRVNPRKTYDEDRVKALGEQIKRAGYDSTRAVKVHRGPDDKLHVFAGSTRAIAAELAGLKSIPAYLYEGYTDEELWALAYEDNDGDDKHTSLPLPDMWADYAAWAAAGYTIERIAQIMKIDPVLAERRVRWASTVKGELLKHVRGGAIGEDILAVADGIEVPPELVPWCDTQTLRDEFTQKLVDAVGVSMGFKPTLKKARGLAATYRELIGEAQKAVAEMGTPLLATMGAMGVRTLVGLRKAQLVVQRAQPAAAAASPTTPVTSPSMKVALEKFERWSKWIEKDDARKIVVPKTATLVLTDPPYGMGYQSGWRSAQGVLSREIAGDETPEAASELLESTLRNLYGQLADDATLLVFTGWRFEPELRAAIERAGYTVRGSAIWVRPRHGMGGIGPNGSVTFAPKHDRILHATKGSPVVNGARLTDVFDGYGEVLGSGHPTEKPVDLLRVLIEACTIPGDCVVEPFAGSGSTVVAALDTGREFRARELDQEYFDRIQDLLLRRAEGK